MNLDLTNKNALICGSTAGIGKATAILLAKLGATVTLVARDEAKLKETLIELAHDKGQKHNYFVADFTNPQQLKDKVEVAVSNKIFHILLTILEVQKAAPSFLHQLMSLKKPFQCT